MSGGDADVDPEEGTGTADDRAFDETVERSFTCTLCGFATTYEVGLLRAEVQSVCANCGDWTTQVADRETLVAAAREAAAALSGPILTERQALAYVLREVMGADREVAAGAMDSTLSNVDNLQRRGAEKVEAARRLVGDLDALRSDGPTDDGPGDEDPGEPRPV